MIVSLKRTKLAESHDEIAVVREDGRRFSVETDASGGLTLSARAAAGEPGFTMTIGPGHAQQIARWLGGWIEETQR